MKLFKITLLSGAIVSASILNVSAYANDELIPDFGLSPSFGTGQGIHRSEVTRQSHRQDREQNVQIMLTTLNKLDLTKDQHEEIEAVFTQYADDGLSLRSELSRAQYKLQAAGHASEANATAIRAEVVTLQKQAQILRVEVQLSVMNVLTIDQEEKFNQIQEQLREEANRNVRT